MWGTIFKGILGSLPSLKEAAEVFVGNRKERDRNEHDEQIAIHESEAKGYTYAVANRTKFDVVMDGLTRLPRPLITMGLIALVWWACLSPMDFRVAMEALSAVPEWLATCITVVLVFHFGSRMIAKDIPKQVAASRLQRTTGVAAREELPNNSPSPEAPRSGRRNSTIDDWKRGVFERGA